MTQRVERGFQRYEGAELVDEERRIGNESLYGHGRSQVIIGTTGGLQVVNI